MCVHMCVSPAPEKEGSEESYCLQVQLGLRPRGQGLGQLSQPSSYFMQKRSVSAFSLPDSAVGSSALSPQAIEPTLQETPLRPSSSNTPPQRSPSGQGPCPPGPSRLALGAQNSLPTYGACAILFARWVSPRAEFTSEGLCLEVARGSVFGV